MMTLYSFVVYNSQDVAFMWQYFMRKLFLLDPKFNFYLMIDMHCISISFLC
jgi:hypothetical protein